MRIALRSLLAAALLCSAASATILTFDCRPSGGSTGLTSLKDLFQSYGDNVGSTLQKVQDPAPRDQYYQMGNGWTPDVTADWATRSIATNAIVNATVQYWPIGASWMSSQSAANQTCSECFGELVLTAAPGYLVQLNSFSLGRPFDNAMQRKYTVNGAAAFVDILGNEWTQVSLTAPVKAQVVTLRWGYGSDQIAIDNINFDQVIAVQTPPPPPPPPVSDTPEPGTMFAAAAGLLSLGFLRRK